MRVDLIQFTLEGIPDMVVGLLGRLRHREESIDLDLEVLMVMTSADQSLDMRGIEGLTMLEPEMKSMIEV